jgi:hypothetical protein
MEELLMTTLDKIDIIYKIIMACLGFTAFFIACANWISGRRAHLLHVYTEIFDLLDKPEMRDARSYVTKLREKDESTQRIEALMEKEHWVDKNFYQLSKDPNFPDYKKWKINRDMVEKVTRSFDHLGLLVREGKVPINLLARFYASPAIRCWFSLNKYIHEVRITRNQNGHLWEWENLIEKIIIPGLHSNEGVWEGVKEHDGLLPYIQKISLELPSMQRDEIYKPPIQLWEIGGIWEWRKW